MAKKCNTCSYKIACELLPSPGFQKPPISDKNGNILEGEECYKTVKRYSTNKYFWKIKPQEQKMIPSQGDLVYNHKNMKVHVFINNEWKVMDGCL